jgi:hypothetical protein
VEEAFEECQGSCRAIEPMMMMMMMNYSISILFLFFFFREAFPLYLAITSVRHVLYTGSRRNDIQIFNKKFRKGLGGVVVSVLATGPKGFGFKTRPRRWIFKDDKNPQHTFLSYGK